jgi:hypothetical protein
LLSALQLWLTRLLLLSLLLLLLLLIELKDSPCQQHAFLRDLKAMSVMRIGPYATQCADGLC